MFPSCMFVQYSHLDHLCYLTNCVLQTLTVWYFLVPSWEARQKIHFIYFEIILKMMSWCPFWKGGAGYVGSLQASLPFKTNISWHFAENSILLGITNPTPIRGDNVWRATHLALKKSALRESKVWWRKSYWLVGNRSSWGFILQCSCWAMMRLYYHLVGKTSCHRAIPIHDY